MWHSHKKIKYYCFLTKQLKNDRKRHMNEQHGICVHCNAGSQITGERIYYRAISV